MISASAFSRSEWPCGLPPEYNGNHELEGVETGLGGLATLYPTSSNVPI